MLPMPGKYVKVAIVGLILLFVLWTTNSSNAAPKAYDFLAQYQPATGYSNEEAQKHYDVDDKIDQGSHEVSNPNLNQPDFDGEGEVQQEDDKKLGLDAQQPDLDETEEPQEKLYSTVPANGDLATATTTAEEVYPTATYAEETSRLSTETPATETNRQRPGTLIEGQNITDIEVLDYLASILSLESTAIPRMECGGEFTKWHRYEILQNPPGKGIQYSFSLNLYQSIPILNRLMATVVDAVRYLGPERCSITIVEGRSTDGTFTILDRLRPALEEMGVQYWLNQSSVDPYEENHNRIEQLSVLRNAALEPLLTFPDLFTDSPQIIFLNDIVVCPEDVFELLYQHTLQNATQTCAMDWIEGGNNFYDIWVSRSMTGDTFWQVAQDGSWKFVNNLFWDDPFTKRKFQAKQPFQVFSCWGGMTVLDAVSFWDDNLRFRRSVEGECYGGEPQILAMDLAKLGLSKVQTIPTVNVGYDSNALGVYAKLVNGYVQDWVDVLQPVPSFENDNTTQRIHWKPPPPKIRCMPNIGDTFWVDTWYDPSKVEDY